LIVYPLPPTGPILIIFLALVDHRIAHEFSDIIALLVVIAFLVSCVVDSEHASHDGCATHVVDGQICAALVFIFQEGKSPAFARFLVANQIYVDWFTVLREYGYDVALRQVKW
jgi:hypothetical protein